MIHSGIFDNVDFYTILISNLGIMVEENNLVGSQFYLDID